MPNFVASATFLLPFFCLILQLLNVSLAVAIYAVKDFEADSTKQNELKFLATLVEMWMFGQLMRCLT